MQSANTLREDLQYLSEQWRILVDEPATPLPLLEVIEFSLDRQRKVEEYVNRMLRYFLAPEEPHGMESDFLEAFLTGLSDQVDFQEDVRTASSVVVNDQVVVGNRDQGINGSHSDSDGYVDLVIESPNEWFLMIELKFGAEENNLRGEGPSQTEFYYRADYLGDRSKQEYESEYYLYLHDANEDSANEPEFSNWTWQAFIDDTLTEYLTRNSPRYPQRTVTQLREIREVIQEITNMTDQGNTEDEKTELYLEHYDAIQDVSKAFEERWDAFTDEWGTQLATSLDDVTSHADLDLGDRLDAIEVVHDEGSNDRWIFRAKHNDWAHILKEGWWRRTDDLSHIYNRPGDREDVRIGFVHRLERNRDLAVGDKTLQFTFRNMGANDNEFITRFNNNLRSRAESISSLLPESSELENLTSSRRTLITATYDIDVQRHDDFFEAYVATLRQAFKEHVIERPELTNQFDEAFTQSLEMYR